MRSLLSRNAAAKADVKGAIRPAPVVALFTRGMGHGVGFAAARLVDIGARPCPLAIRREAGHHRGGQQRACAHAHNAEVTGSPLAGLDPAAMKRSVP